MTGVSTEISRTTLGLDDSYLAKRLFLEGKSIDEVTEAVFGHSTRGTNEYYCVTRYRQQLKSQGILGINDSVMRLTSKKSPQRSDIAKEKSEIGVVKKETRNKIVKEENKMPMKKTRATKREVTKSVKEPVELVEGCLKAIDSEILALEDRIKALKKNRELFISTIEQLKAGESNE